MKTLIAAFLIFSSISSYAFSIIESPKSDKLEEICSMAQHSSNQYLYNSWMSEFEYIKFRKDYPRDLGGVERFFKGYGNRIISADDIYQVSVWTVSRKVPMNSYSYRNLFSDEKFSKEFADSFEGTNLEVYSADGTFIYLADSGFLILDPATKEGCLIAGGES